MNRSRDVAGHLYLAKFLLVIAGLATAAAVSEVTLRILFPEWSPRTAGLTMFWRYDPVLGWAHAPGLTGTFTTFPRDTHVSINKGGFRDVERSYSRDSRYRILAIGDSMVWGYGVGQEEIFTSRMEERRPDIEVINVAVSGYGTDQELLVLQREGIRYKSDLVMAVLARNDFNDNVHHRAFLIYGKPKFELGQDGELQLTNVPVPPQRWWQQLSVGVVRRSFLLNKLLRMYATVAETDDNVPNDSNPDRTSQHAPFPRNEREKITAALLMEMEKTVREQGAEFILVLADRLARRAGPIRGYFEAQGIRVLDLGPEFLGREQPLHLVDRVHWSVDGHRAVAERILKYLNAEQLLTDRRNSDATRNSSTSTSAR